MDTISTALTTAWLDAVRRARSASYQHFVQQVPQAKPPRTDRTRAVIVTHLYGQEINPETYAICKADMLLKGEGENADHIIDMGPEGGEAGGHVVAEGTPEQVAKNNKSYTGQFLARMLR